MAAASSVGGHVDQLGHSQMGGKNWNRLHKLIYVAAVCGIIHYWWQVKTACSRRWDDGDSALLLLARPCWPGTSGARPAPWSRHNLAPECAGLETRTTAGLETGATNAGSPSCSLGVCLSRIATESGPPGGSSCGAAVSAQPRQRFKVLSRAIALMPRQPVTRIHGIQLHQQRSRWTLARTEAAAMDRLVASPCTTACCGQASRWCRGRRSAGNRGQGQMLHGHAHGEQRGAPDIDAVDGLHVDGSHGPRHRVGPDLGSTGCAFFPRVFLNR